METMKTESEEDSDHDGIDGKPPTLRMRVSEEGKIMMSAVEKESMKVRRKMRSAVTGDPDVSIRKHMKEVPQVKMTDKISFTMGVITIVGSEWLALRHPEMFPLYYYFIMTMLLIWRWITYSRDKYQFFMLDICYFVNLSVIIQTNLFPENLVWYKANYVLCMGPVLTAIVTWRNSLVFHSLDKITSFFLHAFPPLTIHLFRWGLIQNEHIIEDDHLSLQDVFVYPVFMYAIWQVLYIFITEVLLGDRFRNDPDLIGNLRYQMKDKKSNMKANLAKVMKTCGLLGEDEELDIDSAKAKFTFFSLQFLHILVTFLPTPFLYTSYPLSFAYISLVYFWGTWNGASYYIEVFAERYRLKFIQTEA